MKKAIIPAIAAVSFLIVSVFSATAENYTLNENQAVEKALKNNVSLEQSAITLNSLKRTSAHSWNSASPSISASASGTVPVDALSDKTSDYSMALSVSAAVSVTLASNLFTQMQVAKHNYEIGKITFEEAYRSIELTVRQNFYGLLYEKENITLQEKNLQIARQQYNNNLAKYNSGRLSEIDVLSAEVNYKGLIPTVENARTIYENNLDSFKQLLGLELTDTVELEGDLDDLVYLEKITLDGHEVKSSKIASLEKKLQSEKAGLLDKRFSAYGPSFKADFNWNEGNWYSGGKNGYESRDPEKSSSVKLTASIPLDGVLPWSSKNDSVDKAKESVKTAELQLQDEKISLQRSIDSSLRSIKQSQEAIKYRQANVTLAQKNYDMTLEAYNRGTKDLLSLQNTSNSLLSAQLSLKNEIYSLRKLILNLENIIGAGFGTLTEK